MEEGALARPRLPELVGLSAADRDPPILPPGTRVKIIGNNRSNPEFTGLLATVTAVNGLGGWHELVIDKTGVKAAAQEGDKPATEEGDHAKSAAPQEGPRVSVQRNALIKIDGFDERYARKDWLGFGRDVNGDRSFAEAVDPLLKGNLAEPIPRTRERKKTNKDFSSSDDAHVSKRKKAVHPGADLSLLSEKSLMKYAKHYNVKTGSGSQFEAVAQHWRNAPVPPVDDLVVMLIKTHNNPQAAKRVSAC